MDIVITKPITYTAALMEETVAIPLLLVRGFASTNANVLLGMMVLMIILLHLLGMATAMMNLIYKYTTMMEGTVVDYVSLLIFVQTVLVLAVTLAIKFKILCLEMVSVMILLIIQHVIMIMEIVVEL